jgi:hypothetical protein
MAVALDTTLSGEESNSYVEVEYADEYWASHFSSVKAALWSALTTAKKEMVLVQACRVIETVRFCEPSRYDRRNRPDYHYDRRTGMVFQFDEESRPERAYYYQALQFPRNIDRDSQSGVYYIPEPILMAQCEQAVYLLSLDDSVLANSMQGVQSESIAAGSVRVSQQIAPGGSMLSPTAYEFLKPFVRRTSSVLQRA